MKSIKKYIKEFNEKQDLGLNGIKKFPLEIFLPITENEIYDIKEGYFISNYSRVYSAISKKILKMKIGVTGYYEFTCACKHKKQVSVALHRILMIVFNPLDDYNGMVVNHIDGNKLNSFLYNLEWTDCKGNMIHAATHNLLHPAHGETHPCAKITARQAIEICELLESRKYRQIDIANMMNIPVSIVE